MEAWSEEIRILGVALRAVVAHEPSARGWGILLEYPLFRVGRRLDAILLLGRVICVIEFKVGAKFGDSAAKRQAEDYALDLRDFHGPSAGADLYPLVCATEYSGPPTALSTIRQQVAPPMVVSARGLSDVLISLAGQSRSAVPVLVNAWNLGA
jgi:hypothetical protein